MIRIINIEQKILKDWKIIFFYHSAIKHDSRILFLAKEGTNPKKKVIQIQIYIDLFQTFACFFTARFQSLTISRLQQPGHQLHITQTRLS